MVEQRLFNLFNSLEQPPHRPGRGLRASFELYRVGRFRALCALKVFSGPIIFAAKRKLFALYGKARLCRSQGRQESVQCALKLVEKIL